MRTKKAVKNLLFNISLQFINIIANMILPPLIIKNYGSAVNGLVMSIKELLRYLQVIGGGISDSSIQSLYKPLAKKDPKGINGVLSASRKLYFQAGTTFSIFLVILALIYPLLIHDNIDLKSTFVLILIMGVSGLSELFVIGRYRTLLIADQKSYVVSIAQISGVICNVLVSVFLIFLNKDILLVQAGATLIYIMRILIIVGYVKKRYKFINFNVDPNLIVYSKRWDALIHTTSSIIVFNSPLIILSISSGLIEASIYSIYSIIFTGIFLITNSFSSGLVASFGEILVKNEKKEILNSYNLYEYIYYLIVTIMYSTAAVLILPFIKIYTFDANDANYIDPLVAILFIVVGVLRSVRIPQLTMVNAAGHFKETRMQAIAEAIISIISQIICVQFWGIYGVLIGAIASFLYRSLHLIIYANNNILTRNSLLSLSRIIRNIILGFVSSLIFLVIIPNEINTFLQLFLWGIFTFVLIGIFIISSNLIFEPKNYKDIYNRVSRLKKNKTTN